MLSEVDNKVLRKLDEWERKTEAPLELIEFYRSLLSIQTRAELRVGIPIPGLSNQAINQRLERGLPLIRFTELHLDWTLIQDVFVEVASIFAAYPKLFGPVPKSLVEGEAFHLPLKEAVKAWFEGTRLPAAILAKNVNEYLIGDMIQATLKPFLAGYSKALLGWVKQEDWRRGYCPVCGGNPDFAFLDKEIGARWLVCSRCDTEWLFHRLQCPFCGNQNQDTLAYLTNDEEIYRLYVCEQCKQYLKAIDLRRAKEEIKIPFERLFTLDIDMQAREQGYGGNKPDTKDSTTNGEWRLV